ncbi:hypothetical protein GCM10023231_02990 [Olivibacter ginsenosidimutans]|uniref:HTH araC/xylS-type domain-containing protein n=1 Tax=Olivibacter ginsenosidimutans TaxID=1176537 RepID=A0ABP9ADI1_9SPHI
MVISYWIALLGQLWVISLIIKQHNKSSDVKRIILLLLECVSLHLLAIVLNIGIPFGLLYGPLVRKAYFKRNGLESKINSKLTNIHLIPFYFFSLLYTGLCLFNIANWDTYTVMVPFYYMGYWWAMTLSLFFYPLSILFVRFKEKFELYELEDRLLDMLVFLCLAVSFPLGLFSLNSLGERNWGFRLDIMIYGILLFALFLMAYYLFVTKILKQKFPEVIGQLVETPNAMELSDEFKGISSSVEAQKIYDCLQDEQLYLKPNISLEILAERVDLPKYICSKLLNEEIGKSFYQLIAEYRIEHAIKLMESDESKRYTIEWLAHASGFSSKTSFNRYFKAYKGCVPSEYQKKRH